MLTNNLVNYLETLLFQIKENFRHCWYNARTNLTFISLFEISKRWILNVFRVEDWIIVNFITYPFRYCIINKNLMAMCERVASYRRYNSLKVFNYFLLHNHQDLIRFWFGRLYVILPILLSDYAVKLSQIYFQATYRCLAVFVTLLTFDRSYIPLPKYLTQFSIPDGEHYEIFSITPRFTKYRVANILSLFFQLFNPMKKQ